MFLSNDKYLRTTVLVKVVYIVMSCSQLITSLIKAVYIVISRFVADTIRKTNPQFRFLERRLVHIPCDGADKSLLSITPETKSLNPVCRLTKFCYCCSLRHVFGNICRPANVSH